MRQMKTQMKTKIHSNAKNRFGLAGMCLWALAGLGTLAVGCLSDSVPPSRSVALSLDGSEPPFDRELSPDGKALFLQRLGDYLENKRQFAVRKDTLLRAGWPAETDTIEQGPGEFVRPGWVPGEVASPDEVTPFDPIYAGSVTARLTGELGREPRPEEVARRIAEDDAETVAINDALAARHDDLARLYQAGREAEAHALEDQIADSVIRPARPSRYDDVPSRYSAEDRILLDARIHITALNREAIEGREEREGP